MAKLIELEQIGLDSVVIVLTLASAEEYLATALRNGADGYLLQGAEPGMLPDKLRGAAKGRLVVLDQEPVAELTHEDTRALPAGVSLTDREHDILNLIAEGMSNKLIASELGISESTVKVHVRNVLRKLDVRSRLEAAIWVLRHRNKQ